jgi:hypothetical protein
MDESGLHTTQSNWPLSPLSVVRLHCRFATPIDATGPLPSKEIENFPKNEHWRRRTLKDSLPCETNLPVFEYVR